MTQTQVGLDHHGSKIFEGRIRLEFLGLGFCFGRPGNPIRAIDLFGDNLNAFAKRHFQRIEEMEFTFFIRGINHGVGQFEGPLATIQPMGGYCASSAGFFRVTFHQVNLFLRIGMETIDTHNWLDTGLFHDVDVVEKVHDTFLKQIEVLFRIGGIQRTTRNNLGSAPMHLQGTNGGRQNRYVGFQATETTFDIPELFKPDIAPKSTLRNVIVKHLETDTIADNGRLSHRDIGKRSCVNHDWLAFNGL